MYKTGTVMTIHASAGRGRHRVSATALLMGHDILLSIAGGTGHHIGSVVITLPRPSCRVPDTLSTTSSVYNYYGHQEEPVARMCAERIAAAFNTKTVAVAGIHVDNATREDIEKIVINVDTLCRRLQKKIGSSIGKQ